MTQRELNRKVAHSTGESVDFVRSMGFSELHMPTPAPLPRGYVMKAAERITNTRTLAGDAPVTSSTAA